MATWHTQARAKSATHEMSGKLQWKIRAVIWGDAISLLFLVYSEDLDILFSGPFSYHVKVYSLCLCATFPLWSRFVRMVINPGFSPSSASCLFLRAFILRALANFDPRTIPEDNETLLVFLVDSWAVVTLLLKGNSRVGHLFSEKPCKCFSYCNTIKKYIFNDLFGSEIKVQRVKFAAYSIFRH